LHGILRFLIKIKLKALILIGGRSSRMGTDKSMLVYHGQTRRQYLYDLLKSRCQSVYLSCRDEQLDELSDFDTLPDRYTDIGPMGALLTAFEFDQTTAWLVVACDMPFVDDDCIAFLVQNRDSTKMATAFQNPDSNRPEPFVTIWEPVAFEKIKQMVANQHYSPSKILQQNDVHCLIPPKPEWLKNINTEADYKAIC
jgi:molybdenum cofactor guanylyltransferase